MLSPPRPSEDIEAALDEALGELLGVPEIWLVRPILAHELQLPPARRATRRLQQLVARNFYLPARTSSSVAMTESNRMLCWSTTNQRRAFGELLTDPGTVLPSDNGRHRLRSPARTVRAVSPRGLGEVTELRMLAAAVYRAAGSVLADVAKTPADLTRLLVYARQHLEATAALLEQWQPAQAVVATQHAPWARAMILNCRRAGISTTYLPHAPMGTNRIYRDLPVDSAALRGHREVETYSSLGVDTQRLRVVGDLSISDDQYERACPDGPIVVAPSPWAPAEVRRFLEIAEEAIRSEYLICPHPRSDVAELRRLAPHRASVATRRTLDVISSGCRALVQHSSGVAVEAMLLGAPVIELSPDGEPPSYFAIREPHVQWARNASDLQQALDRLTTGRDASTYTRAWAREWVSFAGRDAATRLRAVLDEPPVVSGALREEWRTPL